MIEILEARIAPATLVNPTTVTYTDVDGDLVTVKTSLGTLVLTNPNGGANDTFTFTAPNSAGGQQLQLIDFHNGGFDGANLTITVVKKPAGDGLANVGSINSTGHFLGTVTVPGDLGQIDADGNSPDGLAIKSLTVHSMGLYGVATQAAGGSLQSDMTRGVGSINVATDVKEAKINIDFGGAVMQPVKSLIIGGSLIGGDASGSGSILSDAGFGSVKIGGNIIGGAGQLSGSLYTAAFSASHYGAVTIGGSIIGGSGMFSGSVSCAGGDLGAVKIGGNLQAGSGDQSGKIKAKTDITSVSIGGSVLGGIGKEMEATLGGQIFAGGKIGPVTIAHDVSGGTGDFSGTIASLGNLGPVTIGGSLLGGGGAAGSIFSHATLTSVKIAHDVVGGLGIDSGEIEGNHTTLTIGGSLIGSSGSYAGRVTLNLGSVTIGHDVIGGSGPFSGAINCVTLNAVTIGGSLIGGSVSDTGEITAANLGSVKIGRDLVGGSIGSGTVSNDLQNSGRIRGGHIGSVTIGGSMIAGIDDNANRSIVGAMISAIVDLGSLTVTGSIIGNHTGAGASYVTIVAHGAVAPTLTTNVAIGKISVGRRVELAHILAGYGEGASGDLSGDNPDAQVGPVTVGGDWIASSLVAGIQNSAGVTHLGDANDAKITSGTDEADRIARIASIAVGGRVLGSTVASATEHFGFVAEQIGAFKVGGFAFTMKTGSGNDGAVVGRLANMSLHEFGDVINGSILTDNAHLLNASTVTYTDADGDRVTVKLTKPLLTAANVNSVFKFSLGGVDDNTGAGARTLRLIDLTVLATPGLGVTVSAVRGPGPTAPVHGSNFADGVADVGYIKATGLDLGAISVSGDLGAIEAGSGGANATAVASLKVRSYGRYGTTTEPAASGTFTPTLVSKLDGALGALTVTADMKDAYLLLTDTNGDNGKLGAVSIGGSIVGGTLNSDNGITSIKVNGDLAGGATGSSGAIFSGGAIGPVTIGGSVVGGIGGFNGAISSTSATIAAVKIGGNLAGGLGGNDGRIFANLKITSVTVGGSLIGATGTSAEILSVDVGTVSVAHNILGGSGGNSGFIQGSSSLGSVTVGGSLIGRNGTTSAAIFSGGDAGTVKIGHDVVGGTVQDSGKVEAGGRLAGITVSGSLIGGTAVRTGAILGNGGLGPVTIRHDVVGGTAVQTGSINTVNTVGKPATAVTIGGSLIGGAGGNSFNGSGQIRSSGDLGAIVIGHDFLGASISGSAVDLTASGIIQAGGGRIAGVSIGGSIISGLDTSTGGKLISNTTIRANDDLGSLTVKGSIVGRESANGSSPIVITARGQQTTTDTRDLALGSVTVGGLVSLANIEAGFNISGSATNANAQIGAVKVTGNWLLSNLVAGVMNYGADQSTGGTDNNLNFGDPNDHIVAGVPIPIAKIASITIGGIVAGSPTAGRHFGFSSHLIGSFKTAGFTAALQPVSPPFDVVQLSPTTGDVTLREV
ncbi:MAG TPA: hypothetical protein VGO11_18120 [Chthoniobacteraceae bacterium]|jgi:hypothetical protein|nr:hypothetical protein [Chthoniobacteraceae bacterium]